MRSHVQYILLLYLAFTVTGCSLTDSPDNLEPVITILDATDITRSEATIAVRIDSRGGGELSYIRFHYGEGEMTDMQIEPDDQGANIVTAHLGSLKPGTTYSYYAEAGTATANMASKKLSFTTVPNEAPTISRAITLASGPVGICVGFEVTDDGGEPITEVGCDVTNTATNEIARYIYNGGELSLKSYKMYIVGLIPLTSYTITPYCANAIGESKGEPTAFVTENGINLLESGTLAKIFDNNKIEQETMVISGKMNGDDFRFLRRALKAPLLLGDEEMQSNVSSVNLADVQIGAGGISFDGGHFTTPNTVSTGLFAGCVGLEKLILPISTEEIMRDAFSGCTKLLEINLTFQNHTT